MFGFRQLSRLCTGTVLCTKNATPRTVRKPFLSNQQADHQCTVTCTTVQSRIRPLQHTRSNPYLPFCHENWESLYYLFKLLRYSSRRAARTVEIMASSLPASVAVASLHHCCLDIEVFFYQYLTTLLVDIRSRAVTCERNGPQRRSVSGFGNSDQLNSINDEQNDRSIDVKGSPLSLKAFALQ